MKALKDLLIQVCPFPIYISGQFSDGSEIGMTKFCRDKCSTKDCAHLDEGLGQHRTCSKGFSCYPVAIDSVRLVIFGIISKERNTNFTGERRRALKNSIVSEQQILSAIKTLSLARKACLDASNEGAKDSVAHFHDIRTSVGVVLSWCEKLIDASPGKNFEDKLKSVDAVTRNLFGSINLLQEQLELADIIANPSAITYGPKKPSSLTGFWYRMVKLFEPRAHSGGISIKFLAHGNEASIRAYNSFQFLPLVLLDNAIKYSFHERVIYVEISLGTGNLTIAVSSFGPIVPLDFRDKIFEKSVRGPNGIKLNPEGMGLGLFIAKQITDAHGFKLYYAAPEFDGEVGNNKFVLEIPRESLLSVDNS